MKAGRGVKRFRREVMFEPPRRMIDHGFQRAGLGKQMARTWNDFQFLGAAQSGQGIFVQLDHSEVVTSNNEKRWCADPVEGIAGKIGAPSARDDRTDPIHKPCRRDKRGRSTGTGTEQAERKPS